MKLQWTKPIVYYCLIQLLINAWTRAKGTLCGIIAIQRPPQNLQVFPNLLLVTEMDADQESHIWGSVCEPGCPQTKL